MGSFSYHVGQRIKKYRKSRGYTIEQFSAMINKSKATVSKYENGTITIDVETLYDVARALDIDPAAIQVPTLVIGGDKDPYLNLDSMRAAMSKLPSGSKLEIMPGAAHAMMMEKPYYKEFRQKVVEFLEH